VIALRALIIASVAALSQAGSPAVTAPVFAKPDHFWFRKTLPNGHLWLTVNAQHGVKEPLFDHQRLAIELSLRTGNEYTPMTLPLADPEAEFVVKYDGSNAYIQEGAMAIEFILDGSLWRCDLQIKWNWNLVPPTDYECLPRRPMQPGSRPKADPGAPAVSPDGKWEALVDAHNVVLRPRAATGAPTRLSSDGSAADAYLPGSLYWSRDSQTLVGYRAKPEVWLSESVTGNVKDLVTRQQWAMPR
jgi:hypothetical protein